MENLFSVEGKVIAITGGAGVLGGELSKQLSARGSKISIIDYDIQRANQLAETITNNGGTAVAIQANVLDKASVIESLNRTIKQLGPVDILINGAGGNKKEATTSDTLSFFDIPDDAIRWVFDLNMIGTILPSQVFGKHMADAGKGIILNVSSMNAFKPLTKIAAYSAAKAAVSNFTQWLAVHLAKNYSDQIRVNAIAPGFFLTQQNKFLLTDEKTGQLTQRGQTIIDHTPMGRFGNADELTGTVIWLLSEASKFVTGIVVPVDGGFSAFSGV